MSLSIMTGLISFCHPPKEALRVVLEAAKPGVSVLSLCEKGDAYIMAETGKVFKKEKDMKKGNREKVNILLLVYDTRYEWDDGFNRPLGTVFV